jgi:hypothetical protein
MQRPLTARPPAEKVEAAVIECAKRSLRDSSLYCLDDPADSARTTSWSGPVEPQTHAEGPTRPEDTAVGF